MRASCFPAILAALLLFSLPVSAGEILGNSFISEKFDAIEITSPGANWALEDIETQNIVSIASLKRDDKLVSILVTGMELANDSDEGRDTLRSARTGLENMGLKGTPVEKARLGGRTVYRMGSEGRLQNMKIKTLSYLFKGINAYYMYQLMVVGNADYDKAKAELEQVVESTKVF